MKFKDAYFAGGCFWRIASYIDSLPGVKKVICGYSGGKVKNPTYEEVKSQTTFHRETIKIVYDEEIISYQELLKVFLESVDPFDDGGQFIDRGYSYTLAIYYDDESEKEEAIKLIKAIEVKNNKKTYIALEKFNEFYEAEDYHQDYHIKNKEAFEKEMVVSGRKKKV